MNELKVFSNSEFGELGIMVIDGKEYFPAKHCASILGYKDATNAIKQHCKGVVKHHLPTNGGVQTVNYIPEGDLYRLIVSSKLPAAEKFERWVFDEVLPSIRRNGSYMSNTEELIAKTASAVVGEVMRQLVPMMKRYTASIYSFGDYEMLAPKPRRKETPCVISRLDPAIRDTVDDMILSDKFSYADIQAYLKDFGVHISAAALSRYVRRFYR